MFQVSVQSQAIATKISPKGSPSERLWIIAEAPLPKDIDSGYLFSSAMGWSFDKLLGEAGLSRYYITYFEDSNVQATFDSINKYRPPLVVCLDKSISHFFPNIKRKEEVSLWAGSLLQSDRLSFPHYLVPTFGPEVCVSDWTERQIVKYIDLGKVRDELEYNKATNLLRPLKARQLLVDLDFNQILFYLSEWRTLATPLSVDIETIYPKKGSNLYDHPGYPIVVGIAISDNFGISFPLFVFEWTTEQSIKLWRALSLLLEDREIIGQNFHSFDSWYFDMLGIRIDRFKILDTMHRHAVLWPELPHKLQFLTRQYTRQPYYKSEGKGWSIKDLTGLKRYNALDCCVTYEVYNAQEGEFRLRPHLR